MTVIRSASGIRIDCDHCEHHTGARAVSIKELRYATGYINHHGHDLCPSCGRSPTVTPIPDADRNMDRSRTAAA